MQRIKRIIWVTAMLIACVGCDQTATPAGSTTMPAGSTTTPAGSTTTPAGSTTTPTGSTTTPAGSTKINDTDPSIIYSKGNSSTQNWSYFHPAQEDYLQNEHSGNFIRSGGAIPGIGAVVNFTGTGITWIGKKGPQYGIASYSIDGGAPQTVDNYNSTEIGQNPDVTVSGLSADSHVLSISLLDRKHALSVGYWQTIDAFNIDGSPLTRSQGTSAGFNSAELMFKGTWQGGLVSDGSDLSGGHYWSKETNASISWTFIGSLIEVFGRPDYEDGYMDVYIDTNPKPVASVNGHWGSSDDDTLNSYMLFAGKLTPGQHTIKVVVAGRHDNSAKDNYVQIDEFIAFQ
ncbi:MAG: Subtilisin [Gammaproteobacteria bacterium]|nr:Subtilisin [Gammaproteobacteria bacterium]